MVVDLHGGVYACVFVLLLSGVGEWRIRGIGKGGWGLVLGVCGGCYKLGEE